MASLSIEPSGQHPQYLAGFAPDVGAGEVTSPMNIDSREQPSAPDPDSAIPAVKSDALAGKLRARMMTLVHNAIFLYRLLRHPRTPWFAKLLLFFPVMYLCSPIQLIPNFIPVIGQMDDVFIIWITMKLARKLVDQTTWQESLDAAAATELPFSKRTVGAMKQ
jgi:uncharacterized membrane protein YkvA (DUF1232 family)